MLDVCLLGTGGMMPLPNRWLTALLIRYKGRKYLIDCGEGTQITLKMLGWGFKTIDAICFTHYHGDHVTGLAGLLLTIGNSGRTEPLTLIGPRGLQKVVRGLTIIAPELPFELKYVELSEEKTIYEKELSIKAVPVEHTISCFAYVIELERRPKFNPEKAVELEIPIRFWNKLQSGETIRWNDNAYTPDMVLGDKRKGIKVAYCTDSRPTIGLTHSINKANLFVCEGMYGDEEDKAQAQKNKHMTFAEAAYLAKDAEVEELWLTHFSPALSEPDEYLSVATNIFSNTKIGKDRMVKNLSFIQE